MSNFLQINNSGNLVALTYRLPERSTDTLEGFKDEFLEWGSACGGVVLLDDDIDPNSIIADLKDSYRQHEECS